MLSSRLITGSQPEFMVDDGSGGKYSYAPQAFGPCSVRCSPTNDWAECGPMGRRVISSPIWTSPYRRFVLPGNDRTQSSFSRANCSICSSVQSGSSVSDISDCSFREFSTRYRIAVERCLPM